MGEWGSPDRASEEPAGGTPSAGPAPSGQPPAADPPSAIPGDAEPTAAGDGDATPTQESGAASVDDGASGSGDGQDPAARPTRRGAREMAKVVKERDDYLDQLKRSRADFENYRKRISRQQLENLERATEGLIEKLLPVLDNFDAALAHGEGYEQVHASFVALLSQEGLVKIDPKGEPFDPNEADAVAHEDGDDGPVVADVLRAGYKWKGRVLRPAMVRVRG